MANNILDLIDYEYTESGLIDKFDPYMKVFKKRLLDWISIQAYS
jgi:hypothetical protein